jgi:N-acetyltransferase
MPSNKFDAQPVLAGSTLIVRPLVRDDNAGLYDAASDPEIWAGHPSKDRYKREIFQPYFDFLVDSGTALVVVERVTNRIIGCSRYYVAPDQPDSMSIGFTFLARSHWGGETNLELKRLMLGHAYEMFSDVWFHIGPSNIRSQRATAKLGAEFMYEAELDISGSPTKWMCFKLTNEAWNNVLEAAKPA